MKVRERTREKNEYKGCLVDTSDMVCPCRETKPKHLIYLGGRDYRVFVNKIMKTGSFPEFKLYRRCKRCGCTVDLANADFETIKRGKEPKMSICSLSTMD